MTEPRGKYGILETECIGGGMVFSYLETPEEYVLSRVFLRVIKGLRSDELWAKQAAEELRKAAQFCGLKEEK